MTALVAADAVEAFVARARQAGHPVQAAGPGLWRQAGPCPVPSRTAATSPNDVLDLAKDAARARVAWVHAVLPTVADAVRLAAAVHPSAPSGADPAAGPQPAWLRLLRRPSGRGPVGDPTRVPFEQLVSEVPLTVRTLTVHRSGRAVHVTEIPAAWIHHPLTPSEALR